MFHVGDQGRLEAFPRELIHNCPASLTFFDDKISRDLSFQTSTDEKGVQVVLDVGKNHGMDSDDDPQDRLLADRQLSVPSCHLMI